MPKAVFKQLDFLVPAVLVLFSEIICSSSEQQVSVVISSVRANAESGSAVLKYMDQWNEFRVAMLRSIFCLAGARTCLLNHLVLCPQPRPCVPQVSFCGLA